MLRLCRDKELIAMELTRHEVAPYVILTCLTTDKFKTGCLSINLLTQLSRENAAKNALIPRVLRRGGMEHTDMAAISAALDDLYGARLEPVVRKKGEIQTIGFYADFIDDRFVPGTQVLERVAALMGELLLRPNTRGGLFQSAWVESEKEKLLDRIRSVINNKSAYASRRLLEQMCAFEDYAVGALGTEEEAESISYQKLSKHYRALLASSPIEIFYCGSAAPKKVLGILRDVLSTLPRGEIDEDLGVDIRMNAVEEKPRHFTEELDVAQGKLAVGFRLGECMEDPDPAVIRVFNAVYGGCLTSKLFTNVRERLSLCYSVSSACDSFKGIMQVLAGIEFEKYDEALDEIFTQLDAVRSGDITEEELSGAKNSVSSALCTVSDDPGELEDFYLSRAIEGVDCSPAELAELVRAVTPEQVSELARGIECDAVYFLRGTEKEDEDE